MTRDKSTRVTRNAPPADRTDREVIVAPTLAELRAIRGYDPETRTYG